MLNPATEHTEAALRNALPAAAFRSLAPGYLEEPRGRFHTPDALLLAPGSTEDVSTILRHAAAERIPVIPYAGGTGLVAGQVSEDLPRPILLSLERMNAVRSVHPEENLMIVEAGVILAEAQGAAAEAGRLFPLSLASEGSARIGGLLGTNAGGVNVLRYGNARDLCLGVEAVFSDGSVLHGLKRLRKDNTGYDLRNLLIGSEGTLAVITAACLRLFARPASDAAALVVVPDPQAALRLLTLAREAVGDGVSAFELIGGTGLDFLAETHPDVRQPFAQRPDWMVLVDLGLPPGPAAGDRLEDIFAAAFEAGFARDGVLARSEAQRRELWHLRETIPEANRLVGAIASHDISLPIGEVPEFIRRADEMLTDLGPCRINCFGHLGDGNLHYNVYAPKGEDRADHLHRAGAITRAVHDLVQDFGGSFSAEHGIGRLKVGELERYGDPARLDAMRAIKTALDPCGIMNPGAVLAAGDRG